MATPSPRFLLRVMAENFDLLEGLCRYSSHTYGEVAELLQQFPLNDRLSTPFDLVQIGILEVDEARSNYAVAGFIKAFVDKLLHRRHLVDSKLIEGAIQDLNSLRELVEAGLRARSSSRIRDLVLNIQECVSTLHDSVQGNLEGIRIATGEFRKSPPTSSKERWGRIRELWENYVLPMQDIFNTDGPLVEACTKLQKTLDQAEERAPHADVDDYGWAKFYLRRLGTYAFKTYQEAAHEVQPLYDQAKRNARVALSASSIIAAYHQQSINHKPVFDEALWDEAFGLMDPWEDDRTRKPFGTSIASWLAMAYYKRANPALIELAPPPKKFRIPLSDKLVGHRFTHRGGSADDLLGWIRGEFPEAGLREVLRAYHFLLKSTEVRRDGPRRTLIHPEAEITSNEIRGRAHGGS